MAVFSPPNHIIIVQRLSKGRLTLLSGDYVCLVEVLLITTIEYEQRIPLPEVSKEVSEHIS